MTNQGEEWECVHIHNDQVKTLPHLMSEFEEADLRIPIHVLDCFENQHRICVVITSDTDVIVALLYHMPAYHRKVLKNCGSVLESVTLHAIYSPAYSV